MFSLVSRLSNSRGGLSKRGGGAKVVKSLIKSTERHDFCQKLINVEEGICVRREAKSEKKTISGTPCLSER